MQSGLQSLRIPYFHSRMLFFVLVSVPMPLHTWCTAHGSIPHHNLDKDIPPPPSAACFPSWTSNNWLRMLLPIATWNVDLWVHILRNIRKLQDMNVFFLFLSSWVPSLLRAATASIAIMAGCCSTPVEAAHAAKTRPPASATTQPPASWASRRKRSKWVLSSWSTSGVRKVRNGSWQSGTKSESRVWKLLRDWDNSPQWASVAERKGPISSQANASHLEWLSGWESSVEKASWK